MRFLCIALMLVGCSTPADEPIVDAGGTDEGDINASDTSDTNTSSTDVGGTDTGGTEEDAAPRPVDFVDYACEDPAWTPGGCAAGTVTELLPQPTSHVELPTPIEYEDSPPASGDHRPNWAKWGDYEYLPPQRWVHNLEHGGIAFLYNPCADEALIEELRAFARSRPADIGGDFRWVMTPYPGLESAVAAVAWNWTYEAECVDSADLDMFTSNHYRFGPEDVAIDGTYDDLWLGD